jgi:hypothetical protein
MDEIGGMNWFNKILYAAQGFQTIPHYRADSKEIRYLVNPTPQQIKQVAERSKYSEARGIILDGDLYVWAAEDGTHFSFAQSLGYKYDEIDIYGEEKGNYAGDAMIFSLDKGQLKVTLSRNDEQFPFFQRHAVPDKYPGEETYPLWTHEIKTEQPQHELV